MASGVERGMMEAACGALRIRGLPTEGGPAGRSRVRPVLGAGPLVPPHPPAAPKIRPLYGRIGKNVRVEKQPCW